nr:16S rRNA (guanine(527)-N(7))-methyltransferase RsmG [Anaerolineae bacterium]
MKTLIQLAADLFNVQFTPQQVTAFLTYAEELIAWNQHTNLTAITDPEDIEIRHFIDSLSCVLVLKPRQAGLKVIDIGTGAGFPGLPLKILYPSLNLSLVEATRKKLDFVQHMIDRLDIKGVSLHHNRAEELGQSAEHREKYDWVLARAVAGMPTLAEYMLPLAKLGGRCLSQKGENAPQEVVEAQNAIQILGGKVVQLIPLELPTVAETRYLVDIAKVASTPPQYPRRPGIPSKRPIIS